MTDTPQKLVVNASTGASEYIDLTAEEIEQRDKDSAAYLEQKNNFEAQAQAKEALKESARAKLVSGQALTAEEAAVLVI